MKKAVITGAGGFIGKALTLKLASLGYKVYALSHTNHNIPEFVADSSIVPICASLNDWQSIADTVGEEIDLLVHLAWVGISGEQYKDIGLQKQNFEICISTVELAKALNCERFVFAGTMYENLVGQSAYCQGYTRSSLYGTVKACVNQLCEVLTYNRMEYIALAFTNVFGPGDRSKRTPNVFISKLMRGEPLDLIEGGNLYDWIYIDDAVQGVISACEKGISGRQYLIGNRCLRTFREIIENVRDIIAPDVPLNFGKYNDSTFTDFSGYDLDALYNDTGFECACSFEESVRSTCEWVKSLDL